MERYGIPASITLAQGMLESGYGGSRLAVKANNHFGIKCGSSWTGAKIYHNDDASNECFRKYHSVEDSYDDHSKFLTQNKRYDSLFELSSSDYEGWAKGLKAAGYATASNYDDMLIGLIERNNLHQYDSQSKSNSKKDKEKNKTNQPQNLSQQMSGQGAAAHTTKLNNGVSCIIANQGDTWASLSSEFKISVAKLLRVNDLTAQIPIKKGDIIYLKAKKSSNKSTLHHTVQSGETKRSVAQKYGITENAIKRLNKFAKSRELVTGDIVRLN